MATEGDGSDSDESKGKGELCCCNPGWYFFEEFPKNMALAIAAVEANDSTIDI